MSDAPGGPGWWQADDGRWYAPELHPDPAYRQAADATTAAAAPGAANGPEAPPPSGPERSKRSRRLALVGVAVVALLVAGFLVLRSGGGGDGATASDDPGASDQRAGGTGGTGGGKADDDRPVDGIAVPKGFTLASTDPVGAKLAELDQARLVGVDYDLTVEEAGTVASISLPTDAALQVLSDNGLSDTSTTRPAGQVTLVPADGQRFLVVRYRLTYADGYGYGDQVELATDVDGVKVPVELPAQAASGTATWVQAVADDAKDLGLNVHDSETNQTLDLVSGTPRDGAPAVLYRDPTERTVAVNQTITLPWTYAGEESCNGAGRTELALGRAELVWSGTQSTIARNSDAVGHPTDPSQAFLVIEWTGIESTGDQSCTFRPLIPEEAITLVLPDGTSIADSAPLDSSGASQFILFEVPADLTAATLEVQPGDGIRDEGGGTGAYNFGGTVGSVDLALSGGGSGGSGGGGGGGSTTTTTGAGGN
jgi:hypothetical protein